MGAARANLYPTLSAAVTLKGKSIRRNQPLWNKASATVYSDLTIAGQASWEPDFWGRIRRTVEQARANAQATAAEAANVDLTLHAEMATDYFALRGLDSEIKLLTATVADLERQLDLTQRRFTGGVATAVDVAQAQTQLETVRAQLVDLGVARAQYEHAIGTIANYDLSGFSIPSSPLDLALPKVPLGVPSQLLERRPDIAAAERLAAAANAQIGIRSAPFIRLSRWARRAASKARNPGTWIQGPSSLWSLGAQAAELLFDAGQRHALTDAARHSYEAQADGYRNTVFQAFEDVEDQLSGLRILEQEPSVEQSAVDCGAAFLRSIECALQGRRDELSRGADRRADAAPGPADRHQHREPAVCGQREPGARAGRRMGRDATAEIADKSAMWILSFKVFLYNSRRERKSNILFKERFMSRPRFARRLLPALTVFAASQLFWLPASAVGAREDKPCDDLLSGDPYCGESCRNWDRCIRGDADPVRLYEGVVTRASSGGCSGREAARVAMVNARSEIVAGGRRRAQCD